MSDTNKIDDGGPAFPQTGQESASGHMYVSADNGGTGMTYRRWLVGQMASHGFEIWSDMPEVSAKKLATDICAFADALIAEERRTREEKP